MAVVGVEGLCLHCYPRFRDDYTSIQDVVSWYVRHRDPPVDVSTVFSVCCIAPTHYGLIYSLQIMRDPDTGNSKGFAFINFASFEASDAAIEAMSGQHLCNRAITVSYAFKKDSKGERHGSAAGEWGREGGRKEGVTHI